MKKDWEKDNASIKRLKKKLRFVFCFFFLSFGGYLFFIHFSSSFPYLICFFRFCFIILFLIIFVSFFLFLFLSLSLSIYIYIYLCTFQFQYCFSSMSRKFVPSILCVFVHIYILYLLTEQYSLFDLVSIYRSIYPAISVSILLVSYLFVFYYKYLLVLLVFNSNTIFNQCHANSYIHIHLNKCIYIIRKIFTLSV